MLKLVNKTTVYTSIAVLLFATVGWLFNINAGTSRAQDRNNNMRHLLENLLDEQATFLIKFTAPISEDTGSWTLPGDIEKDGNVIAHRIVREIGDDYLCVDEIGQGITDIYCVPFSNIMFITYNPGA